MIYNTIVYIIFGIAPSLIWLSFYLRKDKHPEPKKMVATIFLWGAVMIFPVFFIEKGLSFILSVFNANTLTHALVSGFLIVAFSEEFFKYLVVKTKATGNQNLDEPIDIMLYMIIAALGFATLENILYLSLLENNTKISLFFDQVIKDSLLTTFIRSIGATFIHTMSSAIVGYFMAVSYYKIKMKNMFVVIGILIATLLHGTYNFLITTISNKNIIILIVTFITLILFPFIILLFKRIRKMKSICETK